jgi:hypothetical protein
MGSSPSLLPSMSATQHKEPTPSRETAGQKFPGIDNVEELDIIHKGCSLPVTSSRSVLNRPPSISESTNSPTSATITTRALNPNQMVYKRRQATSCHDDEGDLNGSASTRQEQNAPTTLSTISISRKTIELQPSVIGPSLLRNPLSPPRPVAHFELPIRPVSENRTQDKQSVVGSVESDGSSKLTDSLSYLRTLANANKGPANSTSSILQRYRSHRNVPGTIPSERTSNMETS